MTKWELGVWLISLLIAAGAGYAAGNQRRWRQRDLFPTQRGSVDVHIRTPDATSFRRTQRPGV